MELDLSELLADEPSSNQPPINWHFATPLACQTPPACQTKSREGEQPL
jgi:hypothetical protein